MDSVVWQNIPDSEDEDGIHSTNQSSRSYRHAMCSVSPVSGAESISAGASSSLHPPADDACLDVSRPNHAFLDAVRLKLERTASQMSSGGCLTSLSEEREQLTSGDCEFVICETNARDKHLSDASGRAESGGIRFELDSTQDDQHERQIPHCQLEEAASEAAVDSTVDVSDETSSRLKYHPSPSSASSCASVCALEDVVTSRVCDRHDVSCDVLQADRELVSVSECCESGSVSECCESGSVSTDCRSGQRQVSVVETDDQPDEDSILHVSLQPIQLGSQELVALHRESHCDADLDEEGQQGLDNTDDMVERLLAMEEEERYLTQLLKQREQDVSDPRPASPLVCSSGDDRTVVSCAASCPIVDTLASVKQTASSTRTGSSARCAAPLTSSRRPAAKTPRVTTTPRITTPRITTPRVTAPRITAPRVTTPRVKCTPHQPRLNTISLRTDSHTGRADKTPRDNVTGAGTASCRTAPVQRSLRVYNKLSLQHVQSPVARYIHQIPSPSLIKNVRPPVTTGHVTPARGRHNNNNNNTATASSLSSRTVSADKLSLVSSVSGAASCYARDENTDPCSNNGASSLSSTSTSKCATLVSTAPRLPRVNYVSSGRSVVAEKNWSKAVDCLEPAQSLVKSNPGVCVSVIRHHGKKRVPASRVDNDNKVTAGAVQVALLRRSLSHDHSDSTPMVDVSVVDVKSAVSARAVGTRKPC